MFEMGPFCCKEDLPMANFLICSFFFYEGHFPLNRKMNSHNDILRGTSLSNIVKEETLHSPKCAPWCVLNSKRELLDMTVSKMRCKAQPPLTKKDTSTAFLENFLRLS